MKKSPCDLFIENYIDDEGKSELVYISELIEKFGNDFKSNNGCQWARKGSKLDNCYILKRYNAKELGITTCSWNRVVAIKTFGFKDNKENHNIPKTIYDNFKDEKCAVLGVITSDMEIDHKNAKYDNEEYCSDDFQRLSKSVNDAKREHCKKCRNTCKRFKASLLGYCNDFISGDEDSDTCIGCYWYDPKEFNRVSSSNFIKGE